MLNIIKKIRMKIIMQVVNLNRNFMNKIFPQKNMYHFQKKVKLKLEVREEKIESIIQKLQI